MCVDEFSCCVAGTGTVVSLAVDPDAHWICDLVPDERRKRNKLGIKKKEKGIDLGAGMALTWSSHGLSPPSL